MYVCYKGAVYSSIQQAEVWNNTLPIGVIKDQTSPLFRHYSAAT